MKYAIYGLLCLLLACVLVLLHVITGLSLHFDSVWDLLALQTPMFLLYDLAIRTSNKEI